MRRSVATIMSVPSTRRQNDYAATSINTVYGSAVCWNRDWTADRLYDWIFTHPTDDSWVQGRHARRETVTQAIPLPPARA